MESSLLFNIATLAYLLAMVLYISYLAFRKEGIGRIATVVTASGLVVQTIALVLRWRESYQMDIGRVPLSNLYESLVFFTWSTVLIYLIVEFKYKTRALGAFVLPVAFLALAFINVAGISKDITPLVPALKSNWLFYHVLISFLGYAAFGVAFAISMIYLLMDTEERGPTRNLFYGIGAIIVLAHWSLSGSST
jgi:ABC-type transport system involved in cytochrome c biogenesis permease subunit